MPAQPPPPIPATDAGLPADAAHHYHGILDDLGEMGLEIARALPARTRSRPDDALALAEAFERAARAVCHSIVLARHIPERPLPRAGQLRDAARKRLIREVEDAIEHSSQRSIDARALRAERLARLDLDPDLDSDPDLELDADFDLDLDLLHRPVADIVADICLDLGLASRFGPSPWRRRAPSDLAALCARAVKAFRAQSVAAPACSDPRTRPPEAGAMVLRYPRRPRES